MNGARGALPIIALFVVAWFLGFVSGARVADRGERRCADEAVGGSR